MAEKAVLPTHGVVGFKIGGGNLGSRSPQGNAGIGQEAMPDVLGQKEVSGTKRQLMVQL